MPFDRRSCASPSLRGNGDYNRSSYTEFGFMYFINQSVNESINQTEQNYILITIPKRHRGLVVKSRTLERKVGIRSSLSGPSCVLEQDKFTSQKCW